MTTHTTAHTGPTTRPDSRRGRAAARATEAERAREAAAALLPPQVPGQLAAFADGVTDEARTAASHEEVREALRSGAIALDPVREDVEEVEVTSTRDEDLDAEVDAAVERLRLDVDAQRAHAREVLLAERAARQEGAGEGLDVPAGRPTTGHASGRLVDTGGLVRALHNRRVDPPGVSKRPVNVDLPSPVADGLAEFCARHRLPRTVVLGRLVEELLAGERR